MKRQYTPRRANLTRWLQSSPPHILDCFDDGPNAPHADRFTILFTGDYLLGDGPNTRIQYLGCSANPQYCGGHGELDRSEAAAFRYRNGKRRVRWLDLPVAVRRACMAEDTATA